MINTGEILSSKENNIGYIEFFHPAHNSLPGNLLSDLKTAVDDQSRDPELSITVIKSRGDRTFCAGASFTELASIKNIEEGKKFFMGFANVINAIRQSSNIVIVVVQGKTVGGGVGLASAADYCIATKYASIRLSELAVGIGPFVIGPAVERKIGLSMFTKMSLTPESWQSAEWAKQNGIYHECFESNDEMMSFLNKFTKTLSSYNPAALKKLKTIFWEGTEHWNELLEKRAAISGELVLTKASKDAINSFLQS